MQTFGDTVHRRAEDLLLLPCPTGCDLHGVELGCMPDRFRVQEARLRTVAFVYRESLRRNSSSLCGSAPRCELFAKRVILREIRRGR